MANTKVTGSVIADGAITAAKIASGALDSIIGGYLTTNTYATQSYVTTAVNNLIDAAPASLDTLNELAAALNDDANFATTVTNSLATKLNLSGGTLTGDLIVNTNVGIGTNSPSVPLEVNIEGPNDIIRFTRSGGLSGALSLDFSAAISNFNSEQGGYTFSYAGSEKMRIDSSGNVGIGVTPSSWTSTWKSVDIGGNSGIGGSLFTNAGGATGQIGLAQNWFYDGTNNKYVNSAGASDYYQFGGEHIWRNASSGTAGNSVSLSERMRITSAGNIGIGTSSPDKNLEVLVGGINQSSTIRITGSDGAGAKHPLDLKMDGATDTFSILIGAGGGATPSTVLFAGNRNGNIGIGTSSPATKVDINAGAANSLLTLTTSSFDGTYRAGINFQVNTFASTPSGQIALVGDNNYSGNMVFSTAFGGTTNSPVERMRITSAGNVGIGTSSPIAGQGTPLSIASSTGFVGITLLGTAAYEHTWQLYASGDGANNKFFGIYDRSNAIYRFVATSAGDIGIGTTVPSTKLTVNGGVRLIGTTSANSQLDLPINFGALRWYDGSTFLGGIGTSSWSAVGSGADLTFYLTTGNLHISNTSSPFVTFDRPNGRVGIGTTTATGRLTVSTTGNHIHINNSARASTDYWNLDVASNNIFYVVNQAGTGVYINNGGTSWVGYSDLRLKNIHSQITDGLNSISQLNPVKYSWKNDKENKQYIGLIAQEVETVIPDVVSKDDNGYKGVAYTELIPVLISAIKELKGIVDQQQIEIDNLKAQLNG